MNDGRKRAYCPAYMCLGSRAIRLVGCAFSISFKSSNLSEVRSESNHNSRITFRRGVQLAERTRRRAEHRKPSWCHADHAVHLRHTHAYVDQQIRSDCRQNDVEIHPPFSDGTAEQTFVRLTKARQRDAVCG